LQWNLVFPAVDARPASLVVTISVRALTKYFKMPEDFCYKLLDEAVLVEPLAVAVHVARLADITVGQNVVVFGALTIGLLCAAVAKAMGASKIISVDANDSRIAFARKFAAAGTFQPAREDSVEDIARKIRDLYSLGGVDAVLGATGVESCIESGIRVLKPGDTFVEAGLKEAEMHFPIMALSEKEIHMKGSFQYSSGDYDLAMHLLGSKRVSVKTLITGMEPSEKATDAWERTRKEMVSILLFVTRRIECCKAESLVQ
jgi:D-xylulose reductase